MNLSRDIFKIVVVCGLVCLGAGNPPVPWEKSYKPATGVAQGSGAAKLISVVPAVVPSKPGWIAIGWSYTNRAYGIVFNVYHSNAPALSGMTLLATVSTNFYSKLADQPKEFFGVKAYDTLTHKESDWASK